MNYRTFYYRMARDQELQERYLTAKRAGILALTDRNEDDLATLEAELREKVEGFTDNGTPIMVAKYDKSTATALVMATKLKIEERRFQCMKLLPKLYGPMTGVGAGAMVSYSFNLGEAPASKLTDDDEE